MTILRPNIIDAQVFLILPSTGFGKKTQVEWISKVLIKEKKSTRLDIYSVEVIVGLLLTHYKTKLLILNHLCIYFNLFFLIQSTE